MKIYKGIFNKIISLENLFLAWDKFKKDKKKKKDVLRFELELEKNIFELHEDLKYKRYEHGAYTSFFIQDPKQRHIHKATVRDRILHHAIFSILNPIFEPTFIDNSFSCQIGKGTHKGINELGKALRKVGKNHTDRCFALKCDIKKFFESVNHDILSAIIRKRIEDKDALWLTNEIISSFPTGLPIGNLTSQLFANVYMNELDQFVKHELRIKHYFRYTDDFVVVSDSYSYLQNLVPVIKKFLTDTLKLKLHPNKITIRKLSQGVDFLGYILLSHYRLIKTKTKQRIFNKLDKKIKEYEQGLIDRKSLEQSLQSYLGVLSHTDAYELNNELKNTFWFCMKN